MTKKHLTGADPAALELAEEDLRRSGLTLADFEALGGELLSAGQTKALGHAHALPALMFRYWDPWEQRFIDPGVFHRVRYLGRLPGFAGAVAKPQRYSQPAGSLNSVYAPLVVAGERFDWRAYLSDPDKPLLITEGEKKAACACKLGVPALALGGVTVWSAESRGARELPFLERIELRHRLTYVVFDSDSASGLKPEVLSAARRLMDYLLSRGAIPRLLVLPADGAKVGLDDYLVAHGRERFVELMQQDAVEHSDAKLLCEAAARYVYLLDVDRFASASPDADNVYMTVDHLDRALGKREVTLPRLERVRAPGGGFVAKRTPKVLRLADALLIWGGADKFDASVYRPGEPRVVVEGDKRLLNLWTGWRCEYAGTDRLPSPAAREKALTEWFWALDNLFGDDPVAREYAERWIFYPMLSPGAKLYTFALLCSIEQGVGKSFIGHMLAKHVYGLTRPGSRHAWQLAEGDLHGQFNPYLHAVSFVEGDDIAAHDRKSVYDRVKSFVTSDTVQLNLKNVPQFMIDNRANFWLTSNQQAPFFISDHDRRAFVHIPTRAKKDPERYHRLQLMFDHGIAGPALLWHARERFDPGSFNPKDDAPSTAGKKEVGLAGMSTPREWAESVVSGADTLTRPFATPREVYALFLYEVPGAERYSSDALGHALRDAGAMRWNHGALAQVRADGGGSRRERVWVFDAGHPAARADRQQMEAMLAAAPSFGRKRSEQEAAKAVAIGGRKF